MKTTDKPTGCKKYENYAWDYVEMPPGDAFRTEIENHLKTCESCRLRYEKTATVLQHIGFQKNIAASPEMPALVIEKFDQRQHGKIRVLYSLKTIAAAAVIVIMIGAGIFSGRFVAGIMITANKAPTNDPIGAYAEDTYFADADFFIPGFEFLNE